MSTAKVYAPSAVVTLDGNRQNCNQIVLNLTAGNVSTATCTLHANKNADGGGSAYNALSAPMVETLAALQTRIFSKRSTPDGQITVNDGKGNKLVFNGYTSNPTYTCAPGFFGVPLTFAHESVRLSSFNGSIYAPTSIYKTLAGSGLIIPQNGAFSVTDSNPCLRYKNVLKLMMDSFMPSRVDGQTNNSPFAVAYREKIHAENSFIIDMLNAVLANSPGADWAEMAGLDLKRHEDANLFVCDNILTQTGNFLDNLNGLAQAFQLEMVPDFTGPSVAHFIAYKDIGDGAGTTLALPIADFNFSGGNRLFWPVTNVFIHGPLESTWRGAAGLGAGAMGAPMAGMYPKTLTSGGLILHDSGPPWTTTNIPLASAAPPTADPDPSMNLAEWQAHHRDIMQLATSVQDQKLQPIVDRWAKSLFLYAALQQSTATLPIPLDVSILPGKRYTVTNLAGDQLFSGFLAQVSHTYATAPQQGKATTVLMFSHILAGGFRLPNT